MVAETQVMLDHYWSKRRHPGQQWPYSPFALVALPKRRVGRLHGLERWASFARVWSPYGLRQEFLPHSIPPHPSIPRYPLVDSTLSHHFHIFDSERWVRRRLPLMPVDRPTFQVGVLCPGLVGVRPTSRAHPPSLPFPPLRERRRPLIVRRVASMIIIN
ncbi:hypothetical protein GSI_07807 [Ganoderma sinense ZZ0214-1]|uniref:Uncharacterized protein n=1 Tax=Ganoderma sinense ZZ0214-1 TaxID=1077348 RepID=A0A2G8S841_9APHY|nr:hypothetical protein GSI_07807 [Ganoderma sinense ZZ0214-1]